MRNLAKFIGCAVATMTLTATGSLGAKTPEEIIYPSIKPIVSPFSKISIQTDSEHRVHMSFNGVHLRSINDEDRVTYQTYFSKTSVIDGNYYSNGIAETAKRIDKSFDLWNGRWKKSKYTQEHFQGGFLVFVGENANPFAHAVDGFVSSRPLHDIMNDAVEDFDDHSGLLGEFKATIQRLVNSNDLGYSQANLDFTGDTVGYFVKDFDKLRGLTFTLDTYMHQLSFLAYNWGVDTQMGRTVAHMSKPVMAKNAIDSYRSMGYYPFKMKTQGEYGENKEKVDLYTLLKPVNPLQAVFDVHSLGSKLALDIHLMSYFTSQKTFNIKLLKEVDGEAVELFAYTYQLPELSPFTLLVDLNNKYENHLLWLKMEDVDGILDPILLPIQMTLH
ncbi:MAG: hypothetical protein OXE99_14065 [Cellvibrionales bacterium]|nr:hypothetical protein [Cellvibrionales bacterium]